MVGPSPIPSSSIPKKIQPTQQGNNNIPETIKDYPEWKDRYIRKVNGYTVVINDTPQPNIVEGGFNKIIVSEGLAYGLMLAEQNNDKATFLELARTIKYLLNVNFELTDKTMWQVPWLLDMNMKVIYRPLKYEPREGQIDFNKEYTDKINFKLVNAPKDYIDGRVSASDADIDILAALTRGYRRWNMTKMGMGDGAMLMDLITKLSGQFFKHDVLFVSDIEGMPDTISMILKVGGFTDNKEIDIDYLPAYANCAWFDEMADFFTGQAMQNDLSEYAVNFRKLSRDTKQLRVLLAAKLGMSQVNLPEKVLLNFTPNGKKKELSPTVEWSAPDARNEWRITGKPMSPGMLIKRFDPGYFRHTLQLLNRDIFNTADDTKRKENFDFSIFSWSSDVIPGFSFGSGNVDRNFSGANLWNKMPVYSTNSTNMQFSEADYNVVNEMVLKPNAGDGKASREITDLRFSQVFLAKLPNTKVYPKLIQDYSDFRSKQYGEDSKPENTCQRILQIALARQQRFGWDDGVKELFIYIAIRANVEKFVRLAESTYAVLKANYPNDKYVKDLCTIIEAEDNTLANVTFVSKELSGLNFNISNRSSYEAFLKQLKGTDSISSHLKRLIFIKVRAPLKTNPPNLQEYLEEFQMTKKLAYAMFDSRKFLNPSRLIWSDSGDKVIDQLVMGKFLFNYSGNNAQQLKESHVIETFMQAKEVKAEISVDPLSLMIGYQANMLGLFNRLFENNNSDNPPRTKEYSASVLGLAKLGRSVSKYLQTGEEEYSFPEAFKGVKFQAKLHSSEAMYYGYGDFVSQVVTLLYWTRDPECQRLADQILNDYKKNSVNTKERAWQNHHSIWAIAKRIEVEKMGTISEARKLIQELREKQAEALNYKHYEAYANLLAAEARVYTRAILPGAAGRLKQIQQDGVLGQYPYIGKWVLNMKPKSYIAERREL